MSTTANLESLSYKQLQQLAKEHGISARQKASELIAAISAKTSTSDPSSKARSSSSSSSQPPATDNSNASEEKEEEAPAPKKQRGGRPKKKGQTTKQQQQQQQEEAEDEDEEGSETAIVAPLQQDQPKTKKRSSNSRDEEAQGAEESNGRKSKKSKVSNTAAATTTAPDSEETPAPRRSKQSSSTSNTAVTARNSTAALDPSIVPRITKRARGRKPKRVTDAEPAQEEEQTTTTQQPERRGSRSSSERIVAATAASSRTSTPAPPGVISPPTVHPRPSMGAASARKRWSHLPLEVFGTVVHPPESLVTREQRKSLGVIGVKRRVSSGGVGDHPTANVARTLKAEYAAQRNRLSLSPTKRMAGTAMLEAARLMSANTKSPAPPTPRQIAAYTPNNDTNHLDVPQGGAYDPTLLSQLPLSTNSRASLVAQARTKPVTSSRLSFSKFHAGDEIQDQTAADGDQDMPQASSSSESATQLFSSSSYAARSASTKGKAAATHKPGGLSRAPSRGAILTKTAASKASTVPSNSQPAVPTAAASSSSSTIFSLKSRQTRVGGPAARPPQSRTSIAPSSSLIAPLSAASSTAVASSSVRVKPQVFDLAASLARPINWKMKKGAILPAAAAAASTISTLNEPDAVVSNPKRTTQLKAKEFTKLKSTVPERAQESREKRITQGRKSIGVTKKN